MRLQKRIAVLSGIIATCSLLLAIIIRNMQLQFLCNILIGLFSSGILIFVTSLLSFFQERNATVYSLYHGCFAFQQSLIKDLRIDNRLSIYELRDVFAEAINKYQVEVYYYVCQLNEINHHTKLYRIVMDLWENIRHIYLFVTDDNELLGKYILGDITYEEFQSYSWKHTGEESLSYIDALNQSLKDLAFYMNYFNLRKGKKLEGESADAD